MSERKYWSGNKITKLEENQVFTFGSNPRGAHSFGAALTAFDLFGAIKGQSRGLMGQSYAIVTKNLKWDAGFYEKASGITYDKVDYRSVSPEQISDNVLELYECAKQNPDKEFIITYQNDKWQGGKPKKSLNGYFPLETLGFFIDNKEIPDNITFHDSFKNDIELKLKEKNNQKPNTQNNKTVDIQEAYNTILQSKSEKKLTTFFTPFDVFSQWHPSKFQYKEYNFVSAEQFMMFSKAKLFKDEKVSSLIMSINNISIVKDFIDGKLTEEDLLSSKSPDSYLNDEVLKSMVYSKRLMKVKTMADLWGDVQGEIKSLGKDVSKNDGIPWNEELWNSKREPIIYSGSKLKYSQNEHQKIKLLNTKGTIMVEASPYDKLSTDYLFVQNINDPSKWKGLNLLGKALTNLRYEFTLDLIAKNQITPSKKRRNNP
jgi:ribA/ribD-fused uncharacterized protein